MNAKQVVENLKNHKGQHVAACWTRQLKTRVDVASIVTKRVCAYVRAGIDYSHLASVKDGIATGEREPVEGLKWGEWSEFPFIIAHKGADYVRLYPAVFSNLKKQTVTYACDGVECSPEKARELCLASEFRERDEAPTCFVIKAENIEKIGE